MIDGSNCCDAQKINATSAIVVPLPVPQSVRRNIRSVMKAIVGAVIEVRPQMAVWILGMIVPVQAKNRLL